MSVRRETQNMEDRIDGHLQGGRQFYLLWCFGWHGSLVRAGVDVIVDAGVSVAPDSVGVVVSVPAVGVRVAVAGTARC